MYEIDTIIITLYIYTVGAAYMHGLWTDCYDMQLAGLWITTAFV